MRRLLVFTTLWLLIFLFGALMLSSPEFSISQETQSEEAKQTKALVDEAAALVQSKGTEAFTEFRKKDSKWLKDDTYIFVFKMNVIELFHPIEPELEGTNIIDLKDVMEKLTFRRRLKQQKPKDRDG